MATVDRDIDVVLQFCSEFKAQYLEEMGKAAANLMTVGSAIHSELKGTPFATKSEERIIEMARKIQNAVDVGEEKILILEKKMRMDRDRGEEFTR